VNAVDLCVFCISPAGAERTAAVLQDVLASCLLQRLRTLGDAEKAGLDCIEEEEQRMSAASSKHSKKLALPASSGAASSIQQASAAETCAVADITNCSIDKALEHRALKLGCRVGSGGNGEVWVVSRPADNTLYALKLPRNRRAALFLERELFALQLACGMDHVVQLADRLEGMRVGAWEPEPGGKLKGILLQHVEHVPFSQLTQIEGWGARQARQCSLCLLRGVAALHERRLLHGDIKSSNLLVHPSGVRATLTDFGLATIVDSLRDKGYGTQGQRAPENMRPLVQRQRGEDQQLVEVWACGVVVLCLMKGADWVWTDTELRSKHRGVFGRAFGQDRELHTIAEIAMMEHRSGGGVQRVWKERVGRCAVVMDCALWRWLALEVMYLEVHPVQIEGQPHVRGSVGAAAAAESRAARKL